MQLTNEDKEWISSVFGASESRTIKFVETTVAASEARMIEIVEQTARREAERVETALLTEFHKWATPTDQKLPTRREALRALDLQVEEIAGRVAKLEAAQDLLH